MKPKMILKIGIDIVMTIALLLLMAYQLIGEENHEWIGVFMFVFFILHHILICSYNWCQCHGQSCPYAMCLLGICANEHSSGLSLEHHAGHGEKSFSKILI